MKVHIRPWTMLAVLAFTGCASSPEAVGTGATAPMASSETAGTPAEASVPDETVAVVSDAGAPDLPALYSANQAIRGEGFFRETCLACHESSEFRGSAFERQWSGQTVRDLYASIAYSMPEDNPGGLPAQTYTDIIAYVLELNGYPSGTTELTPDRNVMKAFELWPEDQAAR